LILPIGYVHIFYNFGWYSTNWVYQEISGLDANIALGEDMSNNPLLDPNNPNFNPAIIQQDQMQGITNAATAAIAGTQVPGTSFTGDVPAGMEGSDVAGMVATGALTDAAAQTATSQSTSSTSTK
jgi:hypothetical protein